MLQFIAKQNDRYSIPELVQMAIEGGCKWVQLHVPDMDDAGIRELAQEVVPLCKETSTILTIEGHVAIAKDLGIHGILLIADVASVRDVREDYGPEAIIGVQVGAAAAVMPLRDLDVDYVALTPDMPVERVAEIIGTVRSAEIELPIVASGAYPIDHIPALLSAGVSGLALSDAIADAEDPVAATEEILRIINAR